MNNELVSRNNLNDIFSNDKLQLIKDTICRGSSDDEFQLFVHVCKKTGLDPLLKQIYSVKRWDSNLKRESMSIQTGIDGYRLIAERTGRYSPGREPTYHYDSNGNIISSTAYIKKQTSDGTWHEVAATAFFSEYCQKTKEGKPTRFWNQLGHAMIAKCAEALALRKAFPGDLSGLYTKEEMMQADAEDVTNLSQVKVDTNMSHPASQYYEKKSPAQIPVDHIVESTKMVDDNPKMITKEEWTELNKLIDQCTPPFQQKIWDRLAAMGIQSMAELDEETFKKMRDACLGNIAKQKKAENEVN